jgi:hypothetical protein
MREEARSKARRLLAEGRLTIRAVGTDVILARVRGESAREYLVTSDPAGWDCSCDAVGHCSHVLAVRLVTLEPDHRHGWGGGCRHSNTWSSTGLCRPGKNKYSP